MKLFGTDGIRGPFGRPPIDRPTLTALARELATFVGGEDRAPLFVVGGDTRASTDTVFEWLGEGLAAGGGRLLWAGVLPTPGVAYLTRHLGADCGIAISASHNPYADNGIKLIGADGFKWASADERRLEERVRDSAAPAVEKLTARSPDPDLAEKYLEQLRSTLGEGRPLEGLRVAIDAANGAASPHARRLFEDLGALVHSFHDAPTGRNINLDCGSTYSAEIARLTVETGSDLGVAFDGDADRVIVADEGGHILDGDAILYLWSIGLQRDGRLDPAQIVATQMSNVGLETSLARHGIEVVRCEIGDRAVVCEMRSHSILLGGEQSGHLVHLGLSTTGDGLLSALQIARLARGQKLSKLVEGLERYPQTLHNVVVREKADFGSVPGLTELVSRVEHSLGREGRILLRYSGTEPVARIMIEGRDLGEIEAMAKEIGELIDRHLGPSR